MYMYLYTGAPPTPATGRIMPCFEAYVDNRARKAGEPMTRDIPCCLIVAITTAGSHFINLGTIATSTPICRKNK